MTNMDTVRECRVRVGTADNALRVDDILVRAHTTDVGSRVVAILPAPAGLLLRGPRGGHYRTRHDDTHVIVRVANGRRLILRRGTPAVAAR